MRKYGERIAFISFKSLLDRNSGAAMELHTVLKHLASEDCSVQAFCLNCYDVGDDYKADEFIDSRLNPAKGQGQTFHYDSENIRHYLVVGSSKNTMKLTSEDLNHFIRRAKAFIDHFRPDTVVFFGSNEILPIIRHAKNQSAQLVLYAGVASYDSGRQPLFDACDKVIVPSAFIRDLYRDRFGFEAAVIPTSLLEYPEQSGPIDEAEPFSGGFITLVNPTPDKGAHIFFDVAKALMKEEYLFLTVESRGVRTYWQQRMPAIDQLENMAWMPWQSDIGRVLKRTRLLMMPSLVDEAAGKVISEAMSYGIPCLGYDAGGIKAQIGAGGLTLPLPDALRSNNEDRVYRMDYPKSLVEPFVTEIRRLARSPERYKSLSEAALKESHRYRLDSTIPAWRNVIAAPIARG